MQFDQPVVKFFPKLIRFHQLYIYIFGNPRNSGSNELYTELTEILERKAKMSSSYNVTRNTGCWEELLPATQRLPLPSNINDYYTLWGT